MQYDPRDIAIRTILGEAASESPEGWAAVAHVLNNRRMDPRWPGSIDAVAMQPGQFSAWNNVTGYAGGQGGNHLVNKYGPNDDPYQKVGLIYDQVMSGQIADPTGGSTHYFAPQGMPGGAAPSWWDGVAKNGAIRIGNHVFAPETEMGQPMQFPSHIPKMPDQRITGDTLAFPTPEAAEPEGFDWAGLLDAVEGAQQQTQQQPLQHAPRQVQPYQPVRRDTISPYASLFESFRYG